MKKKYPKLERLARELETMRNPQLDELIAHVRNDKYDRETLIRELVDARLRFFANRLKEMYYDQEDL